jgi:hypothetical protein
MKKISLLTPLFFFVFLLNPAFAQTPTYDSVRKTPLEVKEAIQEKRLELREKREEVRENIKDRLDERRLKLCQVKEKVIQNRASALGRLSENIIDKFTAVSDRVQKYYTEKVVPSGKIVENYDALVSDIETKKIAAIAALENAKANSAEFTCDSDNPKGQLSDFREDMQAFKSALHEYRTSIKNLIVAVRSAAVEGENE